MNFSVLSRREVEGGELRRLRESYCVISICDPDRPEPRLRISGLCVAVLSLKFHDACPEGMALPLEVQAMSRRQASEIWQFVDRWARQVGRVAVHCEQGMSRSPAVAAAIASVLGEDVEVFWQHFQPNEWVYEFLLAHAPAIDIGRGGRPGGLREDSP